MVVDLPDTLELIEINLNDEDPEDQHEGNLQENLEITQPYPKQGIDDAGLVVSGDDMSSSSDSGKDFDNEFDLDYDSLRDQDDLTVLSFSQISLWVPMYLVRLGGIVHFGLVTTSYIFKPLHLAVLTSSFFFWVHGGFSLMGYPVHCLDF